MAKRKQNLENTIIVNGKFLAQKITGVQRACLEILRQLAQISDLKILVPMPRNAEIPEGDFKNCCFIKVGNFKGNLWEQISLPRFCKKTKSPLICLGSLAPVFYKSHLLLHDVTFCEKSKFNKKLWSLKYRILIRLIIYKTRTVFTVSEFSKERIEFYYPKLAKPPVVIYDGSEHINRITPKEINGLPDKYFLAVGSVNGNKNFKYILHLAKNNPDKNFVIAGKINTSYMDFIEKNCIKNCLFTGYVEDPQLIFLYKSCTAFILPSFYEGFGLPPLEAIASGCRALYLSDIPVFREVYGGAAKYFDPTDYGNTVALDCAETMTEEQAEKLLEKCSWKKMAETILDKALQQ